MRRTIFPVIVLGLVLLNFDSSQGERADRTSDYTRRHLYAVAEDDVYKSPVQLLLSPDSRRLFVACEGTDEVLVVDTRKRQVVAQVAVTPDGRFVATALELPKNLIPETQVYQGWMVTYGFALSETRPWGRTAYLLIDEPNLYFADPYGIAFTPDGRYLYISSSGADVVSVVDVEKVYELLEVEDGKIGISDEQIRLYARHLGLSNEHVVTRIATGANSKGLVISADGRWVYVANRLDDSITLIDVKKQRAVDVIDLGGSKVVTTLRRGAKLFNFASISFQKQMSCATCHPENSVDGLIYDIAGPGFRMGEGVACEKCHGPGGDHVQAIEEPQSGVEGKMEMPGEDSCWTCHRSKKSHAELERRGDSLLHAWDKIAHS